MTAIVFPRSASRRTRAVGIDIRAEGVERRDRLQRAVLYRNREQPAATKYHEMITADFDNAALIDAGMLHICHRFGRLGAPAVTVTV